MKIWEHTNFYQSKKKIKLEKVLIFDKNNRGMKSYKQKHQTEE